LTSAAAAKRDVIATALEYSVTDAFLSAGWFGIGLAMPRNSKFYQFSNSLINAILPTGSVAEAIRTPNGGTVGFAIVDAVGTVLLVGKGAKALSLGWKGYEALSGAGKVLFWGGKALHGGVSIWVYWDNIWECVKAGATGTPEEFGEALRGLKKNVLFFELVGFPAFNKFVLEPFIKYAGKPMTKPLAAYLGENWQKWTAFLYEKGLKMTINEVTQKRIHSAFKPMWKGEQEITLRNVQDVLAGLEKSGVKFGLSPAERSALSTQLYELLLAENGTLKDVTKMVTDASKGKIKLTEEALVEAQVLLAGRVKNLKLAGAGAGLTALALYTIIGVEDFVEQVGGWGELRKQAEKEAEMEAERTREQLEGRPPSAIQPYGK